MTIIAVHGRMMVADSASFSGGLQYTVRIPKITRAPDGSLVGAAGASCQTQCLKRWVQAGMNFDVLPKMPTLEKDDEDNAIAWLWLRPDGHVFIGDVRMDFYEGPNSYSIGYRDACNFWQGAVTATNDPIAALKLAIANCVYLGGEPQVEYL